MAQFVAQSEVRSAARRAGLSLRKAPGSPPGGSDLPLHRLPENSPVEAVTLGALSRALVQVVIFTLSTPVPAKLASRGGDGCPARLHGRGFRTGSDRVPVGFRAVSHSQDSIIIRRFRSPARAERGRILSDRYVTSSRQRIPAGFPGSDVKVRAVGCLCAGLDEQPRGVACPHAAAPPWWQEGLVSEHHDHPRARCPGPVARRSGLPERAGARVLSPRVPRGRLRNAPLSQPRDRPRRLPHAVFGPDDHGRVRILTRSRPQALTPHPLLGSAGPSRPASGTREGLDAEETRSPITQHRADNSRRVGDPPLGRDQASEGDGYLATGRRLGHRAAIRGNAGASVHDASRTSHPGRHRARAPHEEERSDGERTGPRCWRRPRRSARDPRASTGSDHVPAASLRGVRGHEKVPAGGHVGVPAGGQVEVPIPRCGVGWECEP